MSYINLCQSEKLSLFNFNWIQSERNIWEKVGSQLIRLELKCHSVSFSCLFLHLEEAGNSFFQILLEQPALKNSPETQTMRLQEPHVSPLHPRTGLRSCHLLSFTFSWKHWLFPCPFLSLDNFSSLAMLFNLLKCLFGAVLEMKDIIELNIL